ncbi:hypothetical protein Acy02nite_34530 [Actinoplanes cyaneus]|uniref:Uncharacterized protein n=1 Tax=Actinoplanes cyaneus TaxID=52696 RepID=A0A919M4F8_9ACTN|nr:hypothetical protein Acy02nite_34530 [Actinoplanes cyaneus]
MVPEGGTGDGVTSIAGTGTPPRVSDGPDAVRQIPVTFLEVTVMVRHTVVVIIRCGGRPVA